MSPVSSRNLLLTDTRASSGHSWNQSMAVQLTTAGNLLARTRSVEPTGEKHRITWAGGAAEWDGRWHSAACSPLLHAALLNAEALPPTHSSPSLLPGPLCSCVPCSAQQGLGQRCCWCRAPCECRSHPSAGEVRTWASAAAALGPRGLQLAEDALKMSFTQTHYSIMKPQHSVSCLQTDFGLSTSEHLQNTLGGGTPTFN